MPEVKEKEEKDMKNISACYPVSFYNEWKAFMKEQKKKGGGIVNITEKEEIYHALTEYMEKHKVKQ